MPLASRLGSPDHAKRYPGIRVKKQKPTKTKTSTVLGVAWYREADCRRIKALFPDADEVKDLGQRPAYELTDK
jgi:hypothetical protein